MKVYKELKKIPVTKINIQPKEKPKIRFEKPKVSPSMSLVPKKAPVNIKFRKAAAFPSSKTTRSRAKSTASPKPPVDTAKKEGFLSQFYKKYIYGPHKYDTRNLVYRANMGENLSPIIQAAFESLKQHAAPGRGQPSTEKGAERFALPVGTVTSKAIPKKMQVKNVTMPWRHLLHPGVVTRGIETDKEGIHVRSIGTGHGIFPRLNEIMSGPLWRSVDRNIHKELNPHLYPEPEDPMGIYPPRDRKIDDVD
ncbi:MAG: hypothetical protein QOC96_1630 [Acidobacteriota bacterium]|jgi:hypothetical protein|nr:hypothetical protein [Acidobacteriota bacterium]